MMQTTVMRMSALIDDVLDFARGRLGGGISLDRNTSEPLEPRLVRVVDELRLATPGRVIEAEFEIDRPVNCDRTRIGQLLSNLVGNALTHGSSNKPVVVRAETTDDHIRTLGLQRGGADPSRRDGQAIRAVLSWKGACQPSGLGLGLYIASQIAKAHGGELRVHSTAAETRFTFVMPLARSEV